MRKRQQIALCFEPAVALAATAAHSYACLPDLPKLPLQEVDPRAASLLEGASR